MSIDAYTPCPGGTGKKVKFCCGGDFLAELQKIDRMLEGQQFLACLHYLEGLLGKERARPRACLLATKCLLLRLTDQFEAARQSAREFLAAYPDNQTALAEMAISTARENAPAAFDFLVSAMEAAAGEFEPRTYSALGQVAAVMLYADFVLPARALLRLQADTAPDDKQGAERIGGALPVAPGPAAAARRAAAGEPARRRALEETAGSRPGRRPASAAGAPLRSNWPNWPPRRPTPRPSGATWRRFAAGWPRTRALSKRCGNTPPSAPSSRMGLTTPSRPKPRRCVFPTIRSAIDRTSSGWFGRSGMRTR